MVDIRSHGISNEDSLTRGCKVVDIIKRGSSLQAGPSRPVQALPAQGFSVADSFGCAAWPPSLGRRTASSE